MTNKELKNKIAEKFVSIMRKLRHIVMGQLMQNCLPYFKTLIMACMKMMEKEEINFTMSSEERQATNDMFYYLGVPDRIRLIPNFSDGREDHRQINDNLNVPENNPKLENIYNLLNTIDNLLDAKDIYGNLKLIEELSLQIEREETNND
jgi:hypothetical protein